VGVMACSMLQAELLVGLGVLPVGMEVCAWC
jgi:hypothetical protein